MSTAVTAFVGTAFAAGIPEAPELVSLSSTGEVANEIATPRAISDDGDKVVIVTTADNLDPRADTKKQRAYIRDRATGTTQLVSLDDLDRPMVENTGKADLSASGRHVALMTYPNSAVVCNPEDDPYDPVPPCVGVGVNVPRNVYVRDTQTGTTTLASLDDTGTPVTDVSSDISISDDGNEVLFISGTAKAYVRDIAAGTTQLVATNVYPLEGRLSGDGNTVAWVDNVNTRGIHIKDLVTGRVEALGRGGGNLAISRDGRRIVFADSQRSYLWDRQTGTVELVSVDTAGGTIEGFSPHISPNGLTVAFHDLNSRIQVRDLSEGETRIANKYAGELPNCYAGFPILNADGSLVTWYSCATNHDPRVTGTNNYQSWISRGK